MGRHLAPTRRPVTSPLPPPSAPVLCCLHSAGLTNPRFAYPPHLPLLLLAGRAACQNGVLLLLAIENRQVYISTGAGTQQQLTWSVLGDIIDEAKPYLKQKRCGVYNWGEGQCFQQCGACAAPVLFAIGLLSHQS